MRGAPTVILKYLLLRPLLNADISVFLKLEYKVTILILVF